MNTYYAYDTESTQAVSETLTITNGQVQLRHIPRQSSVTIPGFIETTALVVPAGRFRVDYFDANSEYRDASRRIYFNAADNGKSVSVGYSAVGTPVTAQDMNEIKNHMANSTLHGGGSGSVNYLGVKYSEPSSGNKGDLYYNYNKALLYIYDGYWYPAYQNRGNTQRHLQIVPLSSSIQHPPELNDFYPETTVEYPDWHFHYYGSGVYEISLPIEIQSETQILGVYNTSGEKFPAQNPYSDYYDYEKGYYAAYVFVSVNDNTGQKGLQFDAMWLEDKFGYDEYKLTGHVVIHYEA